MAKPGTLAAIHRHRLHFMCDPPKDQPWVMDWRSYDIPETVAKAIMNLGPGCVAVTLSPRGGPRMIKKAEHAARKRGIRILWWTY